MEPPGIAPGSGPLITGAFIAIVRANPDKANIGRRAGELKGSAPAAGPGEGPTVVDGQAQVGAVAIGGLEPLGPLVRGQADLQGGASFLPRTAGVNSR